MELAQIVGPDWLETERYEVSAKLPSETNVEQLRLMLQRLLTERFQIRLHREKKVLPVYQLVVGTKGPKLQPEEEKTSVYQSDEENKAAMRELQKKTMEALQAKIRSGDHSSSFHLPRATMARFAEVLSSHLDRPVRDQTHVDGEYAFSLRWFPEDNRQSGDAPLGPSIFAALEEQLGLKLQRANEEMEMLVIDKAEKIPTSN